MNYDVLNYDLWAGPFWGPISILIGIGIILWVGNLLDGGKK